MNKKTKQMLLFLFGITVAVLFDQWSKYLVTMSLKDQAPFVLVDGVFELLYSENRGAAFGMLQGQQVFFAIVVAAVLIGIGFGMVRMPANKKYLPLELCLMLIASGALGNMIDRLRLGYVVDFLYFKLINFPIFNVADCYVTMATALLMFLLLFRYQDEDLQIFNWRAGSKGSVIK